MMKLFQIYKDGEDRSSKSPSQKRSWYSLIDYFFLISCEQGCELELELELELFAELETRNFVGLELENIQSKFELIFICTISLQLTLKRIKCFFLNLRILYRM